MLASMVCCFMCLGFLGQDAGVVELDVMGSVTFMFTCTYFSGFQSSGLHLNPGVGGLTDWSSIHVAQGGLM